MTSGMMQGLAAKVVMAGWLLLLSGFASASDWDEQALMQAMAASNHPALHFTETRHSSYLEIPLRSRGRLEFQPPARLRRFQEGGDSFEINASTLVLEPASGGRREISLDAYPGLRAFVESFRAVLLGDIQLLRRYFSYELRGGRTAWELHLAPTDNRIGAAIDRVSLYGSGSRITRIETYEHGGDYTVMVLQEVQ